jgi:O-antigen ligase
MLKQEVNLKYENMLDYSIFSGLIILALGLITSPSILALSHILFLFPCLYFVSITNWKEIPKSAWALLAMSIAIILSVLFNQDIMVRGLKPIFKTKYFLFGFFLISPLCWWIKNKLTEKRLRTILYLFLIASTFATLSGLIGKFVGINPITQRVPDLPDRNSGLFGMVMNYAHNMSYFLVLLPGIWLLQKKYKEIVPNKFLLIVFLINLIGFFFSYTRGAWLALMAGLPFYFYFKNKKIFIAALLSFGILCSLFFFVAGKNVIRAASDDQRISQWKAAFSAFQERPVLGYGYLNFEEHSVEIKKRYGYGNLILASHAHNNFMEMLGATGAVGFICFILWLGLWMKDSVAPVGLPFIVTFIVGGLTQSTITLGINLFFIIAIYTLSLKKVVAQIPKLSDK